MLDWFVQLPSEVGANCAQPRKIGDWIYFGDGLPPSARNGVSPNPGVVYAINAYPHNLGISVNAGNRQITATNNTQFFAPPWQSDVGTITAPLVSSGRFAVVSGGGDFNNSSGPGAVGAGVEGLGYLLTLIVDGNRLLEVDPAGNAVWSCDSTIEPVAEGGDIASDTTIGTPPPATGVYTTSKLAFARPSTVSEISPDDYLVADTGNNRCVRIDPSGKVLWELSSINDTNHLLGPGEKTTLNQPTSVILWITQDNLGNDTYHYLVADSGNYRIIEVDDQYAAGNTETPTMSKQLVWTSKTFADGRFYRYVSAQRYFAPDGNVYIMGAVTNKVDRPGGQGWHHERHYNGPAKPGFSGSCLGSSLLLSDRTGQNVYTNLWQPADFGAPGQGEICYRTNTTGTCAPFPIITLKTFVNEVGSLPYSTVTKKLRSLRFLVNHTEYNTNNSATYTMIADDDGIFDGIPVELDYAVLGGTNNNMQITFGLAGGVSGASPPAPLATFFQFVPADYAANITPWVDSATGLAPYTNTSFNPASAIQLPNRDYLITNKASYGDPGSSKSFGSSEATSSKSTSTRQGVGQVFGLADERRKARISQPAFALRPNFRVHLPAARGKRFPKREDNGDGALVEAVGPFPPVSGGWRGTSGWVLTLPASGGVERHARGRFRRGRHMDGSKESTWK